jgi:hypothetical protein
MSENTQPTTPTVAGPRTTVAANVPRGMLYDGSELRPFTGRAGATNALDLPSRIGKCLHYRDGRVVLA